MIDALEPAIEIYFPDWFWAKYGDEKIGERATAGMFVAKRYPGGGDEMTEPESAEVEAEQAEAVEDAPETDAAADEASDDE